MSRLFGWSLPPGCSKLPYDDEGPCDVCCKPVDDCICPECETCQATGDLKCYHHHGLRLSREQAVSRLKYEAMSLRDRLDALQCEIIRVRDENGDFIETIPRTS